MQAERPSGGVPVARAAPSGDAERAQITGRAGIVALGTLASRLLGLVREQILAALFTRAATDAFFVAFTIPNVLRQLLAEGAVQTAVLPVLSEVREREGEVEARRFFQAIRGLSLLVLVIVVCLGILFAPALVELFAGGYHAHPGQYERTVELTRWVFPYILCMGTAALGAAALNTHRRFVVTSFAPGLLNVAFIAFALLLPGWLGARGHDQILAMAFGALAGGVLQVVAQWPSLRKIGYLSRPRLDLHHPRVREALRRLVPVLFGTGIYYVDVILARRFLSELDLGSQSYFTFALRLCDLPQGIFVMALQTATLPSLALLSARGEYAEVSRTFAHGMRLALFVAIPASALYVVLAEPLVTLVFQRGHFDAVSSRETARALAAQGFGIWMVAGVRQLVAVYYAQGDTRTPVVVSAIDLVVFIVLALVLRGPLGHVGISIAVTAASFVQLVLLWSALGRRLPDSRVREVLGAALRTLAAAIPAAGAGLLAAEMIAERVPAGRFVTLLPGAGACVVFGVAFLLAARLLRIPELSLIVKPIWRRFGSRTQGVS